MAVLQCDIRVLIVALGVAGVGAPRIAELLGVSRMTAHRHLKAAGVLPSDWTFDGAAADRILAAARRRGVRPVRGPGGVVRWVPS